ncbi:(+)-neomenthol dehydrogenase-like [Diospyros lotus]|uniref:(+)-neomenthol dehydrogenase-like n=1 Tax=Diospyros lotus TaxID=55363 RepID=UPI002255838E|nr:(+)-neomenthol dehydrogenase-like [Diospyros lotus]
MAEATQAVPNKNRHAVVTGSNKGIGFEICRQLACNGVLVVLTARDEKKGLEAVEKLKGCGLSDHVFFHQLGVVDPSSIASLVDFIKTKFGRLDILVNNAGIAGHIMDWEVFQSVMAKGGALTHDNLAGAMTQTYEMAKDCLQTNYYGAKRMIEAFIPLLKLSVSPRIVNVSSGLGQLQNIPGKWVRTVLNDVESLTEERIDELINDEFLQDFKAGSLETRGWPVVFSAYKMSKATMNAYTRILAKKNPGFLINCVCPGYVKTEINGNTGHRSVEEGAECLVKLALLPDDGPTSLFFSMGEVSSF